MVLEWWASLALACGASLLLLALCCGLCQTAAVRRLLTDTDEFCLGDPPIAVVSATGERMPASASTADLTEVKRRRRGFSTITGDFDGPSTPTPPGSDSGDEKAAPLLPEDTEDRFLEDEARELEDMGHDPDLAHPSNEEDGDEIL